MPYSVSTTEYNTACTLLLLSAGSHGGADWVPGRRQVGAERPLGLAQGQALIFGGLITGIIRVRPFDQFIQIAETVSVAVIGDCCGVQSGGGV